MTGSRWGRDDDSIGIGFGLGWISKEHAKYLNMGGIDGFIGDGRINQSIESVIDLFYSYSVFDSFWFTADYQHIENPAYNADRGPVNVYAIRGHFEF